MIPEGTVIKVGDVLAHKYNGLPRNDWKSVKVKRVTPSGQIILENGEKYDKYGSPVSHAMGAYAGHSQYEARPELALPGIDNAIRRNYLLTVVRNITWDTVDNAALEVVVEAVKQPQKVYPY